MYMHKHIKWILYCFWACSMELACLGTYIHYMHDRSSRLWNRFIAHIYMNPPLLLHAWSSRLDHINFFVGSRYVSSTRDMNMESRGTRRRWCTSKSCIFLMSNPSKVHDLKVTSTLSCIYICVALGFGTSHGNCYWGVLSDSIIKLQFAHVDVNNLI